MVRVSARSAVLAVAIIVVALVAQRVFVAAHRPLSWAAAAVIVAVLIDPIVDVLDRRIPRLPAVIIGLLVAAVVIWGVIYVAFADLADGVDQLGVAAQDAAAELEQRDDGIGQLAADVDATRRVDLFVEALDERVTGGDDVLASTAGTAPTYFVGGILTLFLMSYGPRLAQGAVDQLPDPRARRDVTEIVTIALHRSRRAILLTVAQSVVIGLAVAGVARVLEVPVPAALGLTAGLMALLPHVGLVLGTLPLMLLILALRSDVAAAVTVALVLAVQLFDSYWLRRRIARHSVHVGLLVPWIVVLVGYAVYGVGGAAYGLALAVFVLAILDELGRRSHNPVPLDPPPDDAGDEGDGTAQRTPAADRSPSPPEDRDDAPRSVHGVAGYARAE